MKRRAAPHGNNSQPNPGMSRAKRIYCVAVAFTAVLVNWLMHI